MKYIPIALCIIATIIIVTVLIYQKRKKTNGDFSATEKAVDSLGERVVLVSKEDSKPEELVIQIEMLPLESIPDERKLVEITDSKVLAHVNNLVPGLAQAGVAVNNAVQAARSGGEVLYRAILPAGEKLVESKAIEDAFRGFYLGADGIQGHANLVAVEAQKGTAVVANTASAAMSVASLVVGQYYMTQINVELNEISDGISKIADFQDNEFRSRVFSIIAHVKKIADFQVEILKNEELRLSKIAQLDSLEEECTKLLGQANLTLAGYSKKEDLDYDTYEKELKEAQNWFIYQKTMLDVLYKISDLRYTLHFGAVSRKQCTALVPTYTKQVSDTQQRLSGWHEDTVRRLDIIVEKALRKRVGFDSIIHFIPGLFDVEVIYRKINENTVDMIKTQLSGHEDVHPQYTSDLFTEDVQLIAKDGKIYYLPHCQEE